MTYRKYTGDGATTRFSVPFTVPSYSTLAVKVDGNVKTRGIHYAYDGSEVDFSTAPQAGLDIEIYRVTDLSSPVSNFQQAVPLKAVDLNESFDRLRMAVQERAGASLEDDSDPLAGFNINDYLTQPVIDGITGDLDVALQEQIARIDQTITGLDDLSTLTSDQLIRIDNLESTQATFSQNLTDIDTTYTDLFDSQSTRIDGNDVLIGDLETAQADLVQTLSLLGGKTPDGSAFVLEDSLVKLSDDSTLADRFTAIQSQFTTVEGSVTSLSSTVASDIQTLTDADNSLAERLDTVEANINGGPDVTQLTARIAAEETARADADSALSQQLQTISSRADDLDDDIDTIVATQTIDRNARVSADNALSQQISTLTSALDNTDDSIADLQAQITNEESARVTAINAEAQARQTLEATVATKVKTYFGATPPSNPGPGDLWFDSSRQNAPSRWSGTTWVFARDQKIDTNRTLIDNEATARANADQTLGQDISTLVSRFDTLEGTTLAGIVSDLSTLADDTQANADAISTVATQAGNNASAISNEVTARTNAVNAVANDVTTLFSRLGNAEGTISAIQTSYATQANINSAISSLNTSLTSKINTDVGSVNSRVTAEASSSVSRDTALGNRLATVESTWGVTVDAYGSIAGLYLAASNTSRSDVKIRADRVRIVNSAGQGQSPFEVVGGITYVKNLRANSITTDKLQVGSVTFDKLDSKAIGKKHSWSMRGGVGPNDYVNGYEATWDIPTTGNSLLVLKVKVRYGDTRGLVFRLRRAVDVPDDYLYQQSDVGSIPNRTRDWTWIVESVPGTTRIHIDPDITNQKFNNVWIDAWELKA